MSFSKSKSGLFLAAASLAIAACATADETSPMQSPFDANHEALVILDTHLDTPANLVQPWFDIMSRGDYATDYTQVDVPRMNEGGLDGGFWVL